MDNLADMGANLVPSPNPVKSKPYDREEQIRDVRRELRDVQDELALWQQHYPKYPALRQDERRG